MKQLPVNKKVKTTCGEFLDSLTPKQREQYEEEHKKFLILEMVLAALHDDEEFVKKLANLAGVTPITLDDAIGYKNECRCKNIINQQSRKALDELIKEGQELKMGY